MSKRLKMMLNAMRHGVYATGLTPWEDPKEFAAHRTKGLAALRPWHPMLEQTAEEIVWVGWLLIRNQRSSVLYSLCDSFGRQVAKHSSEDWIVAASKLIDKRDAAILSIAKAGQAIVALKAHNVDAKQLKRAQDIGKKISKSVKRIANQSEATHQFFLGLDDQMMRQGKRAMELQSHLQKMRAQYLSLEQWLITRNKLVPQLAAGDQIDNLSADDDIEPKIRRITKTRHDDAGEDDKSNR